MKLYIFPPSGRVLGIVALKNHLALDCEVQPINLGRGDQLTPQYLALNPNKKMPTLEDDGFVLWESNAILSYMAAKRPDSGLWPSDPRSQADVLPGSRGKAHTGMLNQLAWSLMRRRRKLCSGLVPPTPLLSRVGSRISAASRRSSMIPSKAKLGSSASGSRSRIFRSAGSCRQPNACGSPLQTSPKSFAGTTGSQRCRPGRKPWRSETPPWRNGSR
jgi:hypothetical protein